MEQMQKQAEHVGTQLFFDTVVDVDLSRGRCLPGDSGDRTSGCIDISTGATAKWLGIPTEETFAAGGVSPARPATASSSRQEVSVGGGNTAVEEALSHPSRLEGDVIHRRDSFRAEKILQERCSRTPRSRCCGITRAGDHGRASPRRWSRACACATSRPGRERIRDRRRVHRHRPLAQHRVVKGKLARAARATSSPARFDRHRVEGVWAAATCRTRSSAGRNGGRHRLHGRWRREKWLAARKPASRKPRRYVRGKAQRAFGTERQGLREAMSWTGTSCGSSRP